MERLMVQEPTLLSQARSGKETLRTIYFKAMVMSFIKARELKLSSKITKLKKKSEKSQETRVNFQLLLAGTKVILLTARQTVMEHLRIPQENLRVINMSVR